MQKCVCKSGPVEKKSIRGFTLIEVLVAVSVITIGFFGIYSLHLQSIAGGNTIRFYLKAPLLAEKKISEIDADLAELTESSGDFEGKSAGYSWKVTPAELELEDLGSSAEKLKKYDLEIFNESSSYLITVYRFFNESEN